MKFTKNHLILFLTLTALLLTGVIHYQREILLRDNTANFCSGGCSAVQTSAYSWTLGISNTLIGFIGLTLLLILEVHQFEKGPNKTIQTLIEIMITIALLMALRWLYLQKFVIKQWCIYCVLVDIIVIILSIIMLKKHFVKK